MSSGMSRTKGYRSSVLRSGGLGLVVLGLVLGAVYLAVGLILQNSDTAAALARLNRYSHLYASGGPHALQMSFAAPAGRESGFLRLAGPRLRLILVTGSNAGSGVDFPDFDTFSPTLNRSWVSLQQHGGRATWTVVSTQLADGNVLQLGIDSSKTLELRRRIGRIIIILGLFFAPLSFVPAWYQAARNRKKITGLRRVIEVAAAGRKAALPLPDAATTEEAQLVEAVQHLLARHERLVRELQESMDNVAHDLRTPMTRLRTMAEYGLQEAGDSGRLREALADCLEESERVLAMLNTMLSVAEAEAETIALDLQPVDLGETIADVVDLYGIIAEEKNIALEFVSPAPPVMILADRARIGQVWANLVDNAVKYGATRVEITLAGKDDMAEVRVRDNGMGISAAEIDRIWERLFRGDRSRSKQGLGLGLTLVKAMVTAHRGTIEVASELGRGTVFTVRLPLAPAQENRA